MASAESIQRLVDAGLIDAESITDDHRAVLEQLTESEVTILIQIATRLYPNAPGMVKLSDLHGGMVRICVPL